VTHAGRMADGLDEQAIVQCAATAFPVAAGTVVYADRTVRPAGEIQLGDTSVVTSVPCVVIFRDELPGANWMHPCAYALVNPDTRTVVANRASDRPPIFGRLPASWIVASDPDQRADLI
jgi:hypothetical protein